MKVMGGFSGRFPRYLGTHPWLKTSNFCIAISRCHTSLGEGSQTSQPVAVRLSECDLETEFREHLHP